MATKDAAAGNPLPQGDHDRVVMLSLKADGTPDQVNPEIIGDKEFALAAAKEQFKQQAVAAVDARARADAGLGGPPAGSTADAAIDKVKAEHEKAAAAAESAAESTVNALFAEPVPASDTTTSAKASSSSK